MLLCLAGCSGAGVADAGGPPVSESVSQVSSPPAPEQTESPTVTTGLPGTAPSASVAEASRSKTPAPPLERPGFRTQTPGAASVEAHRVAGPNQCFALAALLARTPTRWLQDSVQWSLDGSAVFFTHGRNGYAATVDGTDVHQLVDPAPRGFDANDSVGASRIGGMSAISVSPDGTQLLYSTCEYPVNYPTAMLSASPLTGSDYQYDIALVSTSGGEPRRLTNNDAYDNFPVWSPDGTRIAFLSARHHELEAQAFARPHLFTMAADGSEVRHLARGLLGVVNHPPQWSPDGQWLAFVGFEDLGELFVRNLYTIRADGTDLRRLGPAISGPSWSPDGLRLAFAQPEATTVALVTIAADGSDLRRVTTIEHWEPHRDAPGPAHAWIASVAWSPTGTHILVRPNDARPAFVAGVEDRGVTDVGIVRWDTEHAAASEAPFHGIRAAAWSPDGARLVLVGPRHVVTVAADGGPFRGLAQWHETGESWQPLNLRAGLDPVDVTGCATGAAVPDPEANPGLVTDCATLLEVQHGLADGAGLNWSSDRPIHEWAGIALGGSPLRVHELRIDRPDVPRPALSGLHRPLPAALGRLTQLRVLSLIANQLTGPIPRDLGELTSLRELHLDANHLTGSIPPELAQLANLEVLILSRNELTGPIPADLGHLTKLRHLSLSANGLSGPIPPELGGLNSLERLYMGTNQLTGSIPPELGQVSSLAVLSLSQNELTGSIPSALGQLGNLVYLFLDHNQLTGAIPPALGQLGNLSFLSLTANQLTGPIPAELGQVESLGTLQLSGNRLTGCIPAALTEVNQYNSDLEDLGLPYCAAAA